MLKHKNKKTELKKQRFNDVVSHSKGLVILLVMIVMTILNSCSSNSNKGNKSTDYVNLSMEELAQLDAKGDFLASLQMGRNLWKEHSYDEAVKYFEKATKTDDYEIRKVALYDFGMSQTQKGDYIMQWVKESAEMGFAPAQGAYAANLIKNGHLKEGYDYAQKSIKQNDAMGYYAMAQYYLNLASDPLIELDKELPREENLIPNDRGVLKYLHKSAELGCATSYYGLILRMNYNGATKEEMLTVIDQYKDKYPQLSQDFRDITNGNNACRETDRWTQGWLLLDDIIK